jgi:hypothetical protein
MIKGNERFHFDDEQELHDCLRESWETIFNEQSLEYIDSEISPGLTKSFDFLASQDGVLFVIEVKTNADQGDILANCSRMSMRCD